MKAFIIVFTMCWYSTARSKYRSENNCGNRKTKTEIAGNVLNLLRPVIT